MAQIITDPVCGKMSTRTQIPLWLYFKVFPEASDARPGDHALRWILWYRHQGVAGHQTGTDFKNLRAYKVQIHYEFT